MAKQLYTVEITDVVVVLAEDAREAEQIARNAQYDYSEPDYLVETMSDLPYGWTMDCIPYGGGEKTIGDLIKEGAAPVYTVWLEKLRALGVRLNGG